MKILRTLLLVYTVCCAGAAPAIAQGADANTPSPEALEVAKELLSVISPDMINDINSQMIAQMWPSLEQSLRGQAPNLTPSDWAQMRSEFEQIVAATAMSQWTQMPALYARYLTADEMRDILAFYRTPTGAKTLTILPQIARELSSMTDMAGMMERIIAAFSRILKGRGYGAK